MSEKFATAWDVKSSQHIAVERSSAGNGNVAVLVMDYDHPETVQAINLSAGAAARIAAVLAPHASSENRSE